MSKKEVAAVIVLDGDKFLILKRSKESRSAGFWNFPGGSVEEGEDNPTAGARELKEEADLDIEDPYSMDFLGTLNTKYLNIHFFITDEFSGKVKINSESDDYKWISLSELHDYLFVGGGKMHPDLVESIEDYIFGG